MRKLIFTDRDCVSLIKQYISCLQNRIAQKTIRLQIPRFDLTQLFFIGRVSLKPPQRGYAREDHLKFDVFGDMLSYDVGDSP